MSAVLGTTGAVHDTSMLSGLTSPKPRRVGAGTAGGGGKRGKKKRENKKERKRKGEEEKVSSQITLGLLMVTSGLDFHGGDGFLCLFLSGKQTQGIYITVTQTGVILSQHWGWMDGVIPNAGFLLKRPTHRIYGH